MKAALLGWVSILGVARAQTALPPAAQSVDIDERLGAPVPRDLTFTDQAGRRVRLGSYFDSTPLILIPAYFDCPMLCGLVERGLVETIDKLDRSFGTQYRVITISIDPKDTPGKAAIHQKNVLQALNRPEARDAWQFLVGDERNIRAFADAIGFRYAFDPRSGQYAHAAVIVLLSRDGRITRYLYGVNPAPRDLRLALTEAGEGRVGTITDRLLLTCFRWDPATRRYGPWIFGLFRYGSLVILCAVGGMLFWFARKERKR